MDAHTAATAPALRIRYIGHATTLVELDGVRLLTDPVLRRSVAHLRALQRAPTAAELGRIDAALVSHAHWDHLDVRTLRLLGLDTRLIVAAATLPWLRRRGFRREVEAVEIGDEVAVGPVAVRATPAVHGKPDAAVGFLYRGSSKVYFAGDTDVFPEMDAIADTIDVALLPIWGWGPSLGPGHMDPEGALEAVRLLRPRIVIPIHWGTLHPIGMAKRSFLTEPPRTFRRLVEEQVPDVEVMIVPPGGEVVLPVVRAAPG